jgi:hypothetical protein
MVQAQVGVLTPLCNQPSKDIANGSGTTKKLRPTFWHPQVTSTTLVDTRGRARVK